jgi:hypothetical protein
MPHIGSRRKLGHMRYKRGRSGVGRMPKRQTHIYQEPRETAEVHAPLTWGRLLASLTAILVLLLLLYAAGTYEAPSSASQTTSPSLSSAEE